MTKRYIVTYDICDAKRLRKVFVLLRGFGDHVQYSVFRCDLSDQGRLELIAALHPIIDHAEDQVLIINLGPAIGRGDACVESVGRSYIPPENTSIVL